MCGMWTLFLAFLLLAAPATRTRPDEAARPTAYANDWAGVLTATQRAELDKRLRAFERETTHQVVVAIYEELPSEPMEAFTLAAANRWGVGQKDKNNGVIFFVFVKNKKMRIEVGLGLEKVLTNEKAKAILDDLVTPRLRSGDFPGGIDAAVDAIFAALRPAKP
jgi:uncharacterized protein